LDTSAAVAAGLGLALGVVTGMPLGVVNVAIVEAAAAGDVRFATSVGIGGALADAVHATLAFVGLGGLVIAEPAWTRVLAVAAAVAVVGYAVATWRRRDLPAPTRDARAHRGVAVGLAMTLPNPGALAAWVAVAAAVWPDIAIVDAGVLGASVGVGSGLWFAVLARVVARKRDTRLVRVAARVAVVALVALATFGAVRALAF
jgi:threonine/homoserine/homoserine lactone efflux protein